ncbi:hypothetical protein E8E13_005034 [Curvularia kusanoi]|uniref:Uncharacterized protein n=1 Tax=Curvularia kusanoi TaxID=90978 RepID=A0A9P4T9T9_CURKU|nr:hypothetical protein E8E13_005034 [Curvularia kusanoi]
MRIVCPGYRDPLEELFRDESAAVTKRAEKSYTTSSSSKRDRKIDKRNALSSPYIKGASGTPQSTSLEVPQPSLSQPIEHVALAHFMSSYVPGSHFVYLPELYSLGGEDTALPATVQAASLARLAWELGQQELMQQARHAYTRALAQTNTALSKPTAATSDAVLVSVLLLSLYESIVWADAGTPSNWNKHTQGALALIRIRGKKQLDTVIGRQLFTQVANIICVDSLRSGIRLSSDLLDLQTAALEYSYECPRFAMSSSTGELVTFLAEISEGHLTPLEVIAMTHKLEAKYVAIVSSLPAPWQYDEEVVEPQGVRPDMYGKTKHRYHSNGAAQLWNSYRMTRIFLNGIRHGHARYLRLADNDSLLAQAVQTARQMAADICATVPQFADPKHFSVSSAATLLWPLSIIRSADLVGDDFRNYAEERLKFLGRELRITQAERVAGRREVNAMNDGLHMFYLS